MSEQLRRLYVASAVRIDAAFGARAPGVQELGTPAPFLKAGSFPSFASVSTQLSTALWISKKQPLTRTLPICGNRVSSCNRWTGSLPTT